MSNRKLKFRVWDKKSQVILSNIILDPRPIVCYKKDDYLRLITDDENYTKILKREHYNLEEWIFNQFIGLQDKNKQDIYENDFVRFYLSDFRGKLSKELVGEIKYSENLCHYYIHIPNNDYRPEHYLLREACEIEVVGNSFEGIKDSEYNN